MSKRRGKQRPYLDLADDFAGAGGGLFEGSDLGGGHFEGSDSGGGLATGLPLSGLSLSGPLGGVGWIVGWTVGLGGVGCVVGVGLPGFVGVAVGADGGVG